MTQQTFEEKTLVKVSSMEYKLIEIMFDNASVDEDKFCNLWMEMNPKRVTEAMEEYSRKWELDEIKGILRVAGTDEWKSAIAPRYATDYFTDYEQKILAHADIPCFYTDGNGNKRNRLVGAMIYDIRKYVRDREKRNK